MRRGWQASVGRMLMAMALPLTAAQAADNAVGAAACSVAGGRDASNNTITCNFGLTPEQLKQATEAAVKGATEAQQEHLDKISGTLGVTKDAAEKLLRIVGEDPNVSEDKLGEALTKAAEDFKKLQAQVGALNPDNPTARALVEQARPEIDAGHFDRAHELLRQATQAQVAAAQKARQLREQAQGAEDAQMLGAAGSTAVEGGVAMTERRYTKAAELFAAAAGYVPAGHASERGGYLMQEAQALYEQGEERGDNDALRTCIEVYGRALAAYPRSQAPLDWAKTQTNLGEALRTLGERESETARLDEAVAADRAALEEMTRERVPLDWATVQNDLGVALWTLGKRESGTARLEEAVAADRAALEERTRDRVPLDWAQTQNNLGDALEALGERKSGTAQLKELIAAYGAALEEYTRERVPLLWATTQNNLGAALEALGERKSGTAQLEEAAAAFHAALEELTRERVPLDWAMTENNLGMVLTRLGQKESGTAKLEEAVEAYSAALQEYTRERAPLQWATTQNNLGLALMSLGARKSGTEKLAEAVTAYGAALKEKPRDRVPLSWAASFGNQGIAMMLIADRTNDVAMAETAVQQIETAYETERSGGQNAWAAEFEALLPKAQAIRDRLKGK